MDYPWLLVRSDKIGHRCDEVYADEILRLRGALDSGDMEGHQQPINRQDDVLLFHIHEYVTRFDIFRELRRFGVRHIVALFTPFLISSFVISFSESRFRLLILQ